VFHARTHFYILIGLLLVLSPDIVSAEGAAAFGTTGERSGITGRFASLLQFQKRGRWLRAHYCTVERTKCGARKTEQRRRLAAIRLSFSQHDRHLDERRSSLP
jgi:hypothetical protein